jgi:hypothetical protein
LTAQAQIRASGIATEDITQPRDRPKKQHAEAKSQRQVVLAAGISGVYSLHVVAASPQYTPPHF